MTPTPTTDNAVSPVMELMPIEQAFDALTNLARDIRAELEKPGMTIRNVAAFTGVDKSTVLRAKQQKPISADAYIALSLWLNLSRRSLDTAERPAADSPTVVIGYTNWRGEYGEREIVPMRPWFGATDWHPEPQWLLKAWDVAKDAERDFAVKDIGLASRTPNTEMVVKDEPVATMHKSDTETLFSKGWVPGLMGFKSTPLYASPPSPAQTVTDEQAEAVARAHYDARMDRKGAYDDATAGTKAVERVFAKIALTAALQVQPSKGA